MESPGWRIEASAYDERGSVTCVAAGVIVWRGPLPKLTSADLPDFEVIYCHNDDVGKIIRALGKTQSAAPPTREDLTDGS
ncbi:hypothetical protein M2322_004120 [Rhodoblastus acidophilus]|nr:hypothetical protein [Rhodoblastus acidophilus]